MIINLENDSKGDSVRVRQEQLKEEGVAISQGTDMVRLVFEKNYTKNIFIPILDYLNKLGLRDLYEASVGTREFFEKRNTVSISTIIDLITQPWFIKKVNLNSLTASVCTKIMATARIKKKLFHLKMAEAILDPKIASKQQLKMEISRLATQLIRNPVEHDELFDFASLTHYLLFLMSRILAEHLAIDFKFPAKSEDQHRESEENDGLLKMKAKDIINFYIQQISSMFRSPNFREDFFTEIPARLQELLGRREREIQQKYGLPIRIINCKLFMSQIAEKCFASKRRKYKVNKCALRGWIDKFYALYLKADNIYAQNQYEESIEEEIEIDIEDNTNQDEQTSSVRPSFGSKEFSPIVLQSSLPTATILEQFPQFLS